MGLRTCKDCGRHVSTDAFQCPFCGKAFWTFVDVMGGLFVLLCVVIAGAFVFQNISDPKQLLHLVNQAEGLFQGLIF